MDDRAPLENRRKLAVTLAPLMPVGETSPRRALEQLGEKGFGFVQFSATQPGLRPRELDDSARRDLLSLLRRHELAPSGIDAWIPTAHFGDPAAVDRALAAMFGAIELAADLGRVPVGVNLADAVEPVLAIINHAHHHGVPLADHTIPVVAREGVSFGIDPTACLAQNEDPSAVVAQNSGRLISARLTDLLHTGMRGPVSQITRGLLDVARYRLALNLAGFTRPAILDARQWPDPWNDIMITSSAWQDADAGYFAGR